MGSHDTPGYRSATAERESRWVERLRSAATTQSLSWRLGEQVVADEDVRVSFELERSDRRTRLTAYAASPETYLVRWQSPAGRCTYFEVLRSEFDRDLRRRIRYGRWHVVESA
ncbi:MULTISPECIES: hypothetical protein [Halorussus]|uniref:hypothetical protein n=1 Tax=Halorussus TaxID=1070314 RepID=UPI00209F9357|nr:hypothetical protein [Halorussus vallis]USZ78244.1 hypothetical protein NGM07_23185 [Halorussus vallis]